MEITDEFLDDLESTLCEICHCIKNKNHNRGIIEKWIEKATEANDKKIAELEGKVAGLRGEMVPAIEYLDSLGKLEEYEPEAQMRDCFRKVLANTRAVADAYTARIERRGRAKGLREAVEDVEREDGGHYTGYKPLRVRLKDILEAKAEELEKEVG